MSLKVLTFNVCSDACLLKQTGKPRNGIGRPLATICQDEGCIENVADSIDSEVGYRRITGGYKS
jgi:hypothetical protein